mmetsp:Transcript_27988/g.80900  ORF Transcript_27988/g.80900 Transcript_27988/m.80900 type:complete len:390 (-) Transcript_27988:1250-2419(-)
MTQFACSVILHASVLRLCWRSIKAAKSASDPLGPDPPSSSPSFALLFDVEIPQLWTLLAFHTIYAGIVECLVSWLPFYYNAKMLLLLVTFIPGTRFPNYWFTSFLVPGINKLHAALDLDADWRTYLVHQLRYLPLLLLDLLFVPGILGDAKDNADGDEAGRDQRTGTSSGAEAEVDASELQSPSKSRSRLVASGLQLRNFSREHGSQTPAKFSPSPRKKIELESPAATPTISSLLPRTPATTTTSHGNRSRRRRRRTMNEKFRKVLCGDENIRIRDYLFDLDMPLEVRGGEEVGYLNEERRRRVVVSSADTDGDERRRKQEARNRRRRRTFGGALMRGEELLASSTTKGEANKVGEESTSTKRANGDDGNGNSVSTTVRRSRRIANKKE